MELGILHQPMLQLLLAVCLLLVLVYRKQPVLRFLVVFHLACTLLEALGVNYLSGLSSGAEALLWQYQAMALSHVIKLLLLLVAISFSFALLCHSSLLMLAGYGLIMLVQLVGLSLPIMAQDYRQLIQQSCETLSGSLQFGLLLVLLYPCITSLRQRFYA